MRTFGELAATLAAVLVLLLLGAGTAKAQTTQVSNTGQTLADGSLIVGFSGGSKWENSTSFTTGSQSGGYTLHSVDVRFGSASSGCSPSASIYSTTSGGAPDSSVHALTSPSSVAANAVNTFTAASGATLDASTTYSVVLQQNGNSGSCSLKRTDSSAEDAGAATGWSIANDRRWRDAAADTPTWTSSSSILLIAIKTVAAAPTPGVTAARVDGKTLNVIFDTALNTESKPASSAFAVIATKAGSSRTIAGASALVSIAGNRVTATLTSAVVADETLLVRYDKPASGAVLEDSSGTALPSVADRTAVNGADDTTAPTLVSATVNGSTAVLTFNETLDTNASKDQFFFRAHATTPAGAGAAATGIAISGSKVTLTLAGAVTHGHKVQMSYNRLIAQRSGNLRDLAGNEWGEQSFTSNTITNITGTTPRPVLATVNGTTLTITLSHDLDTGSVPAASAFTVRADGHDVDLGGTTPVAVSVRTVTLTLAAAVAAHEKVTVRYDRPATGRLRNTGGIETQSFANLAAANVTPTPATRIVSVAIVSKPSHDTNSDNTADTYGLVGHDPDENGVFRQKSGEHVLVRVTWSADVIWDVPAGGDLSVPLDVGGSEKAASLRKGRATRGRARSLVFGYQVQAADTDTDPEGFELTPTAAGDLVVLSGGATLLDAQGRAVSRSHPGFSGGATHKVNGGLTPVADATPPKLVHATVNGATVTLTFDDDVKTSTATPTAKDRAELAFAFTIQGGRHAGAVIVNQGPHRAMAFP